MGNISFRPLEEKDLTCMLTWFTDERVLQFYEGRDYQCDLASLREKYLERPDVPGFIIELEGNAIGYSQMYPVCGKDLKEYDYPETEERVFAMDQFIGIPELWNQGIGSAYIRIALRYLIEQMNADAVLLDPHKDNARAVRAYEKAGFRIVKELPAHEMFEGRKVDCWLMVYRKPTNCEESNI